MGPANPQVEDLNGDGIDDLIFGDYYGNVHWYSRNENGKLHSEGYVQANGSSIKMNTFSLPEVMDWNEDGKLDLLVSGDHTPAADQTFRLYINEGTATDYKYGTPLVTKTEGGLGLNYSSPATPHIIDFDGDGKKDLIIGEKNGKISFHKNIGTNDAPLLDASIQIENDNGDEWIVKDWNGTSMAEAKQHVVDWNGDGFYDIIAGGGKAFMEMRIFYGYDPNDTDYEVSVVADIETPLPQSLTKIDVSVGKLSIANQNSKSVSVSLFDIQGRLLHKIHNLAAFQEISVDKFSSNKLLFIQITGHNIHESHKIVTR